MNKEINGTIKFYVGDEKGVVIEKDKYDESIFRDQYEKAKVILKEFEDVEPPVDGEPGTPNILAFCGDRGEGKTSCMLSFCQQLKSGVNNLTYEVLGTIDPSFFDARHNILELVLGQLYGNALKTDRPGSDKDRLMQCFNVVRNCVRALMDGTENPYDAIEELDELGNGMSLSKKIEELLDSYLKYIDRDRLVIVIDDMDYNWKRAYEMTQMIAKYLCHKRCIILVSVSISQMVDVVQTSFQNELRPNGKESKDGIFYSVAYKYISKLIPLQNRVEMPHVYDMCQRKIEIYAKRGDQNAIASYETIKDAVVREIFIKTRYLFYNYRDGVSPIVPNDLRTLRQLLGLLLKMKPYMKDSEEAEEILSNQQNKMLFQSYFFTNWTLQLGEDSRKFVESILDIQDLSRLNKMVVMHVMTMVSSAGGWFGNDIAKDENYSYNVSLGDVFSLLDFIERSSLNEDDQRLVFFIKSYYSMMLYHYYDDITQDINHLYSDLAGDVIFRTDSWFKETNKLQRFINGSYFFYASGDILKKEVERGVGMVQSEVKTVGCDLVCMDGKMLNDLMKKAKSIIASNVLTDSQKKDLRMIEVLILLVVRGSTEEIPDDLMVHRDWVQPAHLGEFSEQTSWYVGDVMAPFSNMVNLKYAYNRFKKLTGDLFTFAIDKDWTLLGKMLKAASQDGVDLEEKQFSLASDAIIRNAEVLTSVKEKALDLHRNAAKEGKLTEMIAGFYKDLAASDMHTYPVENGGDPYMIKFRFLGPLQELLKEMEDNSLADYWMTAQVERAYGHATRGLRL